MIDGLIGGTLKGEPSERTASNGNAYATARLISIDGRGVSHLINVMAFSATTRTALAALNDGDSVAISGTLSVSTFEARDGEIKPSISVIAAAVTTPYAVQRKRKRLAGDDEADEQPAQPQKPAPQARKPVGKGGQGNWRGNGTQRASRGADQLQQMGGAEIARRAYGSGRIEDMPDDPL